MHSFIVICRLNVSVSSVAFKLCFYVQRVIEIVFQRKDNYYCRFIGRIDDKNDIEKTVETQDQGLR